MGHAVDRIVLASQTQVFAKYAIKRPRLCSTTISGAAIVVRQGTRVSVRMRWSRTPENMHEWLPCVDVEGDLESDGAVERQTWQAVPLLFVSVPAHVMPNGVEFRGMVCDYFEEDVSAQAVGQDVYAVRVLHSGAWNCVSLGNITRTRACMPHPMYNIAAPARISDTGVADEREVVNGRRVSKRWCVFWDDVLGI